MGVVGELDIEAVLQMATAREGAEEALVPENPRALTAGKLGKYLAGTAATAVTSITAATAEAEAEAEAESAEVVAQVPPVAPMAATAQAAAAVAAMAAAAASSRPEVACRPVTAELVPQEPEAEAEARGHAG
jgi:hypothetical protein